MGKIARYLDSIGIEAIAEMIESGKSTAEIIRDLGISNGEMYRWIGANEERSARVAAAQCKSAEGWMDKAEKVLVDLPSSGTNADIVRARELASHYRRMAAIRNPRGYGDNVQATVEHTGSATVEHKHSLAIEFVPGAKALPQSTIDTEVTMICGEVEDAVRY